MELLTPYLDDLIAWALACVTTWGVTEPIKRLARRYQTARQRAENIIPLGIAFFVGFACGLVYWPVDGYLHQWGGALLVAASSPTVYKVGVGLLRWKWPAIADAITGARRGK